MATGEQFGTEKGARAARAFMRRLRDLLLTTPAAARPPLLKTEGNGPVFESKLDSLSKAFKTGGDSNDKTFETLREFQNDERAVVVGGSVADKVF